MRNAIEMSKSTNKLELGKLKFIIRFQKMKRKIEVE